ncbi:MAG: tRNA (adenosine(37)-N6)-threonylcarbamoyltransferase complex ATPase subunit type 1 TsaE [Pseudomonadota bacterium]
MNNFFAYDFVSRSPAETIKFGEKLGKRLFPGSIVALTGNLGSGKTCLVQGIAIGLGIPKGVLITSPTYTLVNTYESRIPFFHIDLYRINALSELEDIGFSEIISAITH